VPGDFRTVEFDKKICVLEYLTAFFIDFTDQAGKQLMPSESVKVEIPYKFIRKN